MKTLYKHQWPLVVLALGSPLLYFAGLTIPAAIFLFAAVAILLPTARAGLITRILLACLLVIALNTIIGFLAWIVKIPYGTGEFICLFGLLNLGALFILQPKLSKPRLKSLFPSQDLWALLAMLLTGALLLLPLTLGHDDIALIRIVNNGVDNISHIYLERVDEANQGYVYGNQKYIRNEIINKATSYPQGLHLNEALFNQILRPRPLGLPRPIKQALLLFILFNTTVYSMVVYFFVLMLLEIFSASRRIGKFFLGFLATLIGLELFANIFLGLFVLGFQTQTASLGLIFAEIILLCLFERSSDIFERQFYLLAAAVLASSVAFLYLYYWPVAVLGFGLFVYKKEVRLKLLTYKYMLASLGVILLAGLLQALIYMHYFGASNKINEAGGTLVYSNMAIIGLLLMAVTYLFKVKGTSHLILRYFFYASVLFTTVVYLLQKISSGANSYYYYKSTYLVLIFSSVSLAGLGYQLLSWLKAETSKTKEYVLLGLACGSALLLCLNYKTSQLESYLDRQPFGVNVPYASFMLGFTSDPGVDPTKVVILGNNCVNDYDVRFMRFFMTFSNRATSEQRKIDLEGFLATEKPQALKDIIAYQQKQPDKKLVIITADPQIKKHLIKMSEENAKYLQFIDPYHDREFPATGCPDVDARIKTPANPDPTTY